MKRVGLVVHRCGLELAGGSERLCLDVARHLAGPVEVEILTTCARDYMTWADHYPPGATEIAGVPARRFPVARPRELRSFERLSGRAMRNRARLGDAEATRWMREQGPWSPALIAHLRARGRDYDVVFFFPYLYATTFFGLPEVAERAVLVPCAHDEWPIYFPIWERFFARPRGFVFNTPEERSFLQRRFPHLALDGPIAGSGVEPPPAMDPERFRSRFGLEGPYLLYVGRIDVSKGSRALIESWQRLRAKRPDAPALVLMGSAVMEVPRLAGLLVTGFVDEQTKWDALAGCAALVMPSPYESLSIALLEAWSAGRPVLANGACSVLVGQTRRSRGGLWYRDADEFEAALARLLDPALGEALGAQGRRWVAENCGWDRVMEGYRYWIDR